MKDLHTLLYNEDVNQVQTELLACKDKDYLNGFALEYNCNNGFDIPKAILSNLYCSLGTALVLFYQGDGYRYLTEKPESSDLPEWLTFISSLYSDIKEGKFGDTSVQFEVPLSKIQIFKLKKMLADDEQILSTIYDNGI